MNHIGLQERDTERGINDVIMSTMAYPSTAVLRCRRIHKIIYLLVTLLLYVAASGAAVWLVRPKIGEFFTTENI
jgi:hypothetical protein